ncbi:hypothetical protein BT93_I1347, partial [Corymbia citriodora subsp. variegata]
LGLTASEREHRSFSPTHKHAVGSFSISTEHPPRPASDVTAPMAPPPGPYSGTSTLALVARVSAFTFGVAYGNMKLKYLKAKAKSQRKTEAKAHH